MGIKKLIIIATIITFVMTALDAKVWNFEDVQIGKLPKGWTVDETHRSKKLPTWEVLEDKTAPSKNHTLTLSHINSRTFFGGNFNLCFTKDVDFLDGEISVMFRANSGKTDQGGGIMWRVKDRDNYYVARFNPLEDNFRFYSVKKGVRSELKSANIKLSQGWHKMTIVQKEKHFEGYLDGEKLLESDDDTFTKSGGVGLWTKADAATSFDDFNVTKSK